jgi:hypothetical protein
MRSAPHPAYRNSALDKKLLSSNWLVGYKVRLADNVERFTKGNFERVAGLVYCDSSALTVIRQRVDTHQRGLGQDQLIIVHL